MSKQLIRSLLTVPVFVMAMTPAVARADTVPVETSRPTYSWEFVSTGGSSQLFGVDVVEKDVVWAAGEDTAVVVRTVDGGRAWRNVSRHPIVDALRLHDVQAFGRDRAKDLYDGITFFDSRRGLALGDPVGDRFRLLSTTDGGRTWTIAPTDRMPRVENNEAAHATGTSLVAIGPRRAWFGTAPTAGANSRVFRTRDGGRSWTAAPVPIRVETDNDFGVVSLVFWDLYNGVAIGGGIPPDTGVAEKRSVAAVTRDGGRTWTPAGQLPGFRLNAVRVPNRAKTAVAVGPTGSDVTTDGGRTWHRFDKTRLAGISCEPRGTCWAVGANGAAAKLVSRRS